VSPEELAEVKKEVKPDICISAKNGVGIDPLKDIIFDKLNLMRIYCKEVSKKADMEVPLIIKKSSTLHDMCEKLHKDFVKKFTFAKVWGSSVKHSGQKVMKLTHVLKDNDVVEIHLK